MPTLRILIFFLTLLQSLHAQPWQKMITGPTGTAAFNLSYNYNSQFGGVAIYNKPYGDYHHSFVSFNQRGDTVFRKSISFDTLPGPNLPHLISIDVKIDYKGNRVVYGSIFSWPNNTYKGFIMKFDSLGNFLTNRYLGDFDMLTVYFNMLPSKNNFEYDFYSIDSLAGTFINSNNVGIQLHKLVQYISKRDQLGNLIWRLRWDQMDSTFATTLFSDRVGFAHAPIETSDGMFTFLRWDKTMLQSPILQKINANGVTQYSVQLSNYISQVFIAGVNQVNVSGAFATNDTSTVYYGTRASLSNTTITENFLLKINKNGQLIDSLFLPAPTIMSGAEVSDGNILLSYHNYLSSNSSINPLLAEGILVLNKNLGIKKIIPAQSLEAYNFHLVPNNLGGCLIATYLTYPYAYNLNTTTKICSYDSLFNTYPNSLSGNVYEDNNKNCSFDFGDLFLSQKPVVCTDAQNNSFYGFSDSNGAYSVKVPNGTYTVTQNPGIYRSVICPNPNLLVNFNGTNTLITQNYFDSIVPNIYDLKVSLVGDPFWLGNVSSLTAYYENIGTVVSSATIQVIKDAALNYSFSIPSASTINGDTAFYILSNILPGGSGSVNIYLSPSPNIGFGNQITFNALISGFSNDADFSNNTDSISNLFYGALKTSSPSLSVSTSNNINVNKPKFINGNEELFYKIRFQNTTGSLVKDVLIINELDTYLDFSSLKIISASSPYTMTINSKGKMIVTFKNINLVDSVQNEALSKGFLVYSIKPQASWPVGKFIKNHANIYIDYLNPITTNQTINQKQISITSIKKNHSVGDFNAIVYPNPANDHFNIYCKNINTINSIELYNLLGQIVIKINPEVRGELITVDLSVLDTGFYILQLNSSTEKWTKKVLVEK